MLRSFARVGAFEERPWPAERSPLHALASPAALTRSSPQPDSLPAFEVWSFPACPQRS